MAHVTITFLGCGELGTSILCGILQHLAASPSPEACAADLAQRITQGRPQQLPDQKEIEQLNATPTTTATLNFIACVRSQSGASRVISEIEEVLANVKPSVATVMTLIDENVRGVANADVVLLGCKPYMLSDIISSPQMRSILKKRTPVLISLLGGVTEHQVAEMIYSRSSKDSCPPDSPLQSDVTNIVRAMPNISARMRASMTIISPIKSLSVSAVATSLFRCVGKVKVLPSSLFDPATALCASGPALFASVIQAFIDGAVEIGIGKDDAVELTVETMRSTIDLLSPGGMTSHDLITRVATKGGATEKGLKVMKEAKSRDILIQTLAAVSFAMHGLGSRPE